MLPKNRPPTSPGEMLREEFLKPRGMTQVQLAAKMRIPIQRVNTLINGKRGITADTALLLAEALGTTPEFWMNLQCAADLWAAVQKRKRGAAARRGGGRRVAAAATRRAAARGE